MDQASRTAECDGLTPECRSLYNVCAKFGEAFCLSNVTSLEKQNSMISKVLVGDDDFNPDACTPCSKHYLASTLKSAVLLLDYAAENTDEVNETETSQLQMIGSSIGTVLSITSLTCMKDNNQEYCGARMEDPPASAESFTAQSLCDACGKFDTCSETCKAKFETLMDLFDSCSTQTNPTHLTHPPPTTTTNQQSLKKNNENNRKSIHSLAAPRQVSDFSRCVPWKKH